MRSKPAGSSLLDTQYKYFAIILWCGYMRLLAPQVWGLEEQHEHIQKIQQESQSLEKHESAKTEPMVLAQLAGLYLSLG